MRYILEFIVALVIAMVFLLVLTEWAAGCGESYIGADGVRHQYKCVFIPNKGESK